SFGQKLIVDTVCFNTPFDDYGVRIVEKELFVVSASKPNGDGKSLIDATLSIPYSDVFKIQGCELIEAKLLSKDDKFCYARWTYFFQYKRKHAFL
ncbi:MAG: hypothetical protein RJA13_1792, partial [Bacteroidota bacterium]